MKWIKYVIAAARKARAAWKSLPPEDREKIKAEAAKLSKRVLKK